jgi:hypothetical protein
VNLQSDHQSPKAYPDVGTVCASAMIFYKTSVRLSVT